MTVMCETHFPALGLTTSKTETQVRQRNLSVRTCYLLSGSRVLTSATASLAVSVSTSLRWLILVVLLVGWGSPLAHSERVELTDPKVVAKGSQVFTRYCSVGYCHGAQGRSGLGPVLRDRAWNPQEIFDVVAKGRSGTLMPAFSESLYPEDIWSIVAYVVSLGSLEPGIAATVEFKSVTRASDLLSEQARRGRSLFFDLTNERRCSMCHQLEGNGTPVGPKLVLTSQVASAEELQWHILEPNAAIAEGFEQTIITTDEGERVIGVAKERTDELIRIYDSESIPSPLRTFYRNQIRSIETQKRSSMPGDYGDLYSSEELAAIIAYLKEGVF